VPKSNCGSPLKNGGQAVQLSRQVLLIGEVENMVIEQSERGSGYGATLLNHIERFCRQADCTKIMLLSNSKRESSHVFFQSKGLPRRIRMCTARLPGHEPLFGFNKRNRLRPLLRFMIIVSRFEPLFCGDLEMFVRVLTFGA